MGCKYGRYSHPDIAATVTCLGRLFLQKVNNYVKSNGHQVLYGDTDSIFFNCGDEDPLKINDSTNNNLLIDFRNLNMEYEKTFTSFLLIAKKKYVGYSTDHKYVYKGVDIVRHDQCLFHQSYLKKFIEKHSPW